MGRVQTNNTAFQIAREASEGTLGGSPDWLLLEPNTPSAFGDSITTVARRPIGKRRSARKGVPTDADAGMEYEMDLTMDVVDEFASSFLFCAGTNDDVRFNEATATGTGFTIPAADASQAAKFQFTSGGPISLVYARGYATTANNGLHALDADLASTDTEVSITGLSAETAPATAVIELAGIRAETGDLALAISGSAGTLSSGNNSATNNVDFTTLGLTVGQYVHVGGLATGNQLSEGAGFARITAIAAGSLSLDKLDSALAVASGAGDTVDLLFGNFYRDVEVDDTDYSQVTYHGEASYPNLGSGGATEYEYVTGNSANTMAINVPLTDKATVTVGFTGLAAEDATTTRKTNADSPREPVKTAALSTATDVARIQIAQLDETALSTDFKSLTLTVNNNLSGERVIGNLGPDSISAGSLDISIEGQAIFTDGAIPTAIRNNTTLSLDFAVDNDDGAAYWDLPALTIGGGGKEFTLNETVKINLTGEAFGASPFNHAMSVSTFPVTP